MIVWLCRDGYYHGDDRMEDAEDVTDVIIAKQRNGLVGSVTLRFDTTTGRFVDHSDLVPLESATPNTPKLLAQCSRGFIHTPTVCGPLATVTIDRTPGYFAIDSRSIINKACFDEAALNLFYCFGG